MLQYILPGLSGHLPSLGGDPAWPDSMAGHQTLFVPGWLQALSDSRAAVIDEKMYHLVRLQDGSSLRVSKNYLGGSGACGD